MNRSIDFFRDEVRNGFYIPTAIKQAWAAALDVLDVIDDICTRHGIRYYADWGTALGTVRHGGYVPWDDDLDICMLRDDYDRFREVADAELPQNYVIHDYERKENHWLFLARVVNNSRMCFEEKYLDEHNNFPWLVGIDIFIKDYLYEDAEKEKARDAEIMDILAIAQTVIDGDFDKAYLSSKIEELSGKYHVRLPKVSFDEEEKRKLAAKLYRLAEKQMARVKPEETNLVGQIFPWVLKNGNSAGEKKSWYENSVRLPFEDVTIPMPARYNEMLRSRYGDYCTFKKVWSGHNYPFFEGQRKEMEEISGESFAGFKFDESMLERVLPDKSGSLKTIAKECLSEMERLFEAAKEQYLSAAQAVSDSSLVLNPGDKADAFTQTVGDLQQLAADLGTLAENVKGEKKECTIKIVGALQRFCDVIWEEYNEVVADCIGSENGADAAKLHHAQSFGARSLSALSEVSAAVKENILDRKEVLFLSIGPLEWNALDKYYREAVKDDKTDVVVIPLPFMKKRFLGEINMTETEIDAAVELSSYPSGIEYTNWRDYDLEMHAPEIVYTNNLYDGANPCLTIPPYYYSQNVIKYADEVIYVPIADTSEISSEDIIDIYNMGHYVVSPGVILADKIMVQSENIKRRYVEVLTAFAGQDSKDIWEKKIEAAGDENTEKHKLKRLLFCIGANEVAECEGSFAQLLNNKLDAIRNASADLKVSVLLYPSDDAVFREADLDRYTEMLGVLRSAKDEGIVDLVPDYLQSADVVSRDYDAYYGSPSPFVPAFFVSGKPVMIADFKV